MRELLDKPIVRPARRNTGPRRKRASSPMLNVGLLRSGAEAVDASPAEGRRTARRVAIVFSGDAVSFVASERSTALLAVRLAAYVAERAEHTLWPQDAAAVQAHLDAGRYQQAVARYFETVGRRWDVERLTIRALR